MATNPTKPKKTKKQNKPKKQKLPKKKKSPKKQKPKVKCGHIGGLTPLNLKQQRELFFDSGCTINPLFQYSDLETIQNYLAKFSPQSNHLSQAQLIINNTIQQFGSQTTFMEHDGGEILTIQQTLQQFNRYAFELGIQGQVSMAFSQDAIAPTRVTHDPLTSTSLVTAALPLKYRRRRIKGVFHHQLGTHLVRTYNERKQVWYKKRKKFDLLPYIETQEGFASLNTQLQACVNPNRTPYLFKAASHYYVNYLASQMSFVDLYQQLWYVNDPLVRFREVLRAKRGLEDTSQPGGCYKDQVYLSGALKVLQVRREIDWMTLISGKLSVQDHFRPDIQSQAVTSEILIPPFLRDIPSYLNALDILAVTNGVY